MLCVDIFGGNEGAMAIVNNLISSGSKRKHIGVKSPFCKDVCVQERLVYFMYETNDQYADILTKALWHKMFIVHCAGLTNLV